NMPSHPPPSNSFPYTTLFRSVDPDVASQKLRAVLDDHLVNREQHIAIDVPIDDTAARRLHLKRADIGVVPAGGWGNAGIVERPGDRKSTRLNSSHDQISYAVF